MTAFPYIQSIMMKIRQALEKVEKDFRESPSLAYWVPKEIEEKLREMFSSARNAGDLERALESMKKLLARLKQLRKQLEERLEEEAKRVKYWTELLPITAKIAILDRVVETIEEILKQEQKQPA